MPAFWPSIVHDSLHLFYTCLAMVSGGLSELLSQDVSIPCEDRSVDMWSYLCVNV